MSGAKDKADARILTERIEHWPSMAGWWRTSPIHPLFCADPGHGDVNRLSDGVLVFIPGNLPGRCYCEEHQEKRQNNAGEYLADLMAQARYEGAQPTAESSPTEDLRRRDVIARERLAAAAERFANSFESLVNPVVRYIKHVTRQQ